MPSLTPLASTMTELRIATRRSRLAVAQATAVASLLTRAHLALEVTLVEVTTTGDKDRLSPVADLTEVGAFVRAVQRTVLDGEADLAVHSCKDLPVDGPDGLTITYPEREQPWDVLCGHDLDSLPRGARVGTGSPRRSAQFARLRPDARIVVVPTAQIRFFLIIALLIISTELCPIMISSLSILCLDKSSTSTGLKVPRPT